MDHPHLWKTTKKWNDHLAFVSFHDEEEHAVFVIARVCGIVVRGCDVHDEEASRGGFDTKWAAARNQREWNECDPRQGRMRQEHKTRGTEGKIKDKKIRHDESWMKREEVRIRGNRMNMIRD